MPKLSSPDLSKFVQLKTKTLSFIKEKGPLPLVIAGVAIIGLITSIILVATSHRSPTIADLPSDQTPDTPDEPSISNPSQDPETPPAQTPDFIDLQPTIDAWRKTTTANVGLMIYDLDNDRVAASYQPDRVFSIASIYKLFFVYDGYRQIESGAMNADTTYVTTNDHIAGTHTYGKCLDLMIRASYNGCADKVRSDKKAFARVDTFINDELKLENTTNGGLLSTAADLTELLKLYYTHPDLSDTNWQKIADSMLNQPATKIDSVTTYSWRQGLPSGFSAQTKVYDKVGWAWNADSKLWSTYADAAIIEFPSQNRHYTAVVLTSNLPDRNAAAMANLGTRIEDAVLAASNGL